MAGCADMTNTIFVALAPDFSGLQRHREVAGGAQWCYGTATGGKHGA
jgi:hypothetical protein